MSDKKELKVGDRVSWTSSSNSGSTFNFKTLEGTVREVSQNAAYVQKGNGRKEWINLGRLRPANEKSELTEAFQQLGEAAAEAVKKEGRQ